MNFDSVYDNWIADETRRLIVAKRCFTGTMGVGTLCSVGEGIDDSLLVEFSEFNFYRMKVKVAASIKLRETCIGEWIEFNLRGLERERGSARPSLPQLASAF